MLPVGMAVALWAMSFSTPWGATDGLATKLHGPQAYIN